MLRANRYLVLFVVGFLSFPVLSNAEEVALVSCLPQIQTDVLQDPPFSDEQNTCVIASDLNGAHVRGWPLRPEIEQLGERFGRDFMLRYIKDLVIDCFDHFGVRNAGGTRVTDAFDDQLCECNNWVYDLDFQCKSIRASNWRVNVSVPLTERIRALLRAQDEAGRGCIALLHVTYQGPFGGLSHMARAIGIEGNTVAVEDPANHLSEYELDPSGNFPTTHSVFPWGKIVGIIFKCPVSLAFSLEQYFASNKKDSLLSSYSSVSAEDL
ncbi:hypothetical protein OAO01_03330 [Oligoflexia bacterium]|nr:hypothetical protein [Oligoflexia bacterium]